MSYSRCCQVIELLLENGANPNLPNINYNAMTVAQEMGDQTIINLLNAQIPLKRLGLKKIP